MVQTIQWKCRSEERLSDHVYRILMAKEPGIWKEKINLQKGSVREEKGKPSDKNEHTGKEQKMEHQNQKKHAMEL